MAELADLVRAVADGGMPATDLDLTVLAPPDDRSVGVLAFPGHNVVAVDLAADRVRTLLPPGDLAGPVSPPFLTVLAAATGLCPDNLDLVLVAPATGRPNGMELTELTDFGHHPPERVALALSKRIGVRAWRCPGGLVTLGRGVAGRWEVSVEVDSALRGFGLGRGLFTAARGLLPAGEHVWAQVAPGNAASVRAALAAGFRPVGAEVLLHASKVTFDPFGWFDAPDKPERVRPESELDVVQRESGVLEPESAEEPPFGGGDEMIDPDDRQAGDRSDSEVSTPEPLSVSDEPALENETVNSDD